MGREYEFIQEIPNHKKLKIFFITILIAIFLIASVITTYSAFQEVITKSSPYIVVKEFFQDDIKNLTPTGLFYLGLLGGLFIFPVPIEAFFIAGFFKGNPYFLTAFLVIAATIPGHAIDYYLGYRFREFIMYFISKRKVYQARRWVTKYGSYAILAFNILPMPAPVLTFALGIAKYNVMRLFILVLLGNTIKYLGIALFFALF